MPWLLAAHETARALPTANAGSTAAGCSSDISWCSATSDGCTLRCMHSRLLLLCATALLSACSTRTTFSPASATITGTASYRERMMLPPDATLEVTLEDVSRADAPADVIARSEVQSSKAPPYSFTLAYDPARINPSHRYNVRARIMADDKLMFQSDAGYAVLGAGNVTHVDILLKRASAATARPAHRRRTCAACTATWPTPAGSSTAAPACAWPLRRKAITLRSKPRTRRTGAWRARRCSPPSKAASKTACPWKAPGPRPTLIVEKFISVAPEGCSGPSSTAQLENTYWKLMTLGNASVESPEGAREIHLVLNSQDMRVNGFAGCNRMSGGYELRARRSSSVDIAGTMMACADGMEIERGIHEMLRRSPAGRSPARRCSSWTSTARRSRPSSRAI